MLNSLLININTNMKYFQNVYQILLVLTLILISVQGAATRPKRSATVINLCPQGFNRQDIGDIYLLSSTYSPTLNLDFTNVNNTLLSKFINQAVEISTKYDQSFTFFGAYFFSSVVITALLIVVGVFTLIYCICPSQRFPRKCRSNKYMYTKFQRIWPAITVLFGICIMIAGGVWCYINLGQIQFQIDKSICQWGILFDDLMNGNSSQDGLIFSGFGFLSEQLRLLQQSSEEVKGYIEDIKTNLTNIQADLESLKDEYEEVMTGSPTSSNVADFSYQSPFTASTGLSALNSAMPRYAGYFDSDSDGKLSQVYSQHNANYNKLNYYRFGYSQNIQNRLDQFIDNYVLFKSNINTTIDELSALNEQAQTRDNYLYNVVVSLSPYISVLTLISQICIGLILGMIIPYTICIICMTCCEKHNARYILYFLCGSTFFVCLVLSLVNVTLSFAMSLYNSHVQIKESQYNYDSFFLPIFEDYLGTKIFQCMKFGDYNWDQNQVMLYLASNSSAALTSLSFIIDYANNFDPDEIKFDKWRQFQQKMNKYNYGQQFDFNSIQDQNLLNRLSNPSSYGCSVGTFQSDSWIPTIKQPNSVSCKIASASNADSTDCPTSAQIMAASGTCGGCMDSDSILDVIGSSGFGNLTARYPGGGDCDTWVTEMQNAYNNYYQIKKANYQDSNIISRIRTTEASVLNFKASMISFQDSLMTILSNIQSLTSQHIVSQENILSGWNYSPLKQDYEVTWSFSLHLYFIYFFSGIIVCLVGSMILMIFTVIAGARDFKNNDMGMREIMPKSEMKMFVDVRLF